MRKHNVFGKKISQVKVIYFIVLIFAIVFGARVFILNLQTTRLENYKAQEAEIISRINLLINSNQTEEYHLVGEIIQYLPNTYNQAQVNDEIEFILNLSGLSLSTEIDILLTDSVVSPFTTVLASTVKFVSINVSFSTSHPQRVLDFVEHLYNQDRLYYVDYANVSINDTNSAQVNFTIYTFYNNVVLS
jgi:hypothetical protein